MTADVYLFGNDRVLKVFRPSFFEYAGDEYKKTVLAGKLGIHAPKVYGLTATEYGDPAIEMEYIPGMNLSRYISKHPVKCFFLLIEMSRLSVRMESVPYTYPEAEAAFASECLDKKRWAVSRICRIGRLQGILPEEIARMQRFYESIPESGNFVHGDFGPSNVLVCEKEERLRPIDFGFSGFGSWLFDLMSMYDRYYDPESDSGGRLRPAIRRLYFRFYLDVYLRSRGGRGGMSAAVILRTVGAMVNIGRLIDCVSSCPEPGSDAVRKLADAAMDCIDSLPDGVFPPDRTGKEKSV